jgi:hypothetical protein
MDMNWQNPQADKVGFSDGTNHTAAPGDSFPIQPGTTDLAALLGKGAMILTGSSTAPKPTSLPSKTQLDQLAGIVG